jgi:hypothetical protein
MFGIIGSDDIGFYHNNPIMSEPSVEIKKLKNISLLNTDQKQKLSFWDSFIRMVDDSLYFDHDKEEEDYRKIVIKGFDGNSELLRIAQEMKRQMEDSIDEFG